MNRRTLQTLCWTTAAVAALLLVADSAVAAPECVQVRGEGVLTQPAGPLTDWTGPVSLTMRGRTYAGEVTLFIDPLLLGNSGPPAFRGTAFDWFTFDLGDAGSFSAWELATFEPLDSTLTTFQYQGVARLGPSYVSTGVYGPPGGGMFAGATGILHARGTMWMTFPAAPNSVDFRYTGRICGVDWK